MNSLFWPGSSVQRGFDSSLRAAVAGGFGHMAITPMTLSDLLKSGRTAQDVAAEARDKGVIMSHFDAVSSWAPIRFPENSDDFAMALFGFEPNDVLDMAAAAGIEAILAAGTFKAGELPLDVLIRCFADFCDAAAQHSIRVDLEFVCLWGIPDLPLAWNIVREANRPNGGILVDTYHLDRGSSNYTRDIELLRSLPAGCVENIQLSDAPAIREQDWMRDLFTRTFPGDGALPIAEMVEAANASGGVKWIGPELFGPAIDTLSDEAIGEGCMASMRSLPIALALKD